MSENVQKFRVLRLPRYPMLVDGTMIDFMVDSREARSTIRPCDLPCEPRMTDLVFESTSASGHIISENYTVPLKCETEGGRALKTCVLCSETCPVPLMARDLMCKLNLKLTAGPFGIEIEEEQQMSCAKFEPQWAYEWQIRDSDWAQMILKLAKIEQCQLTQKICCLTDCIARHMLKLSVNHNMRKSGLTGQKMRK